MDMTIMGCNDYKHEHCNSRGIVTQSLVGTKALWHIALMHCGCRNMYRNANFKTWNVSDFLLKLKQKD
jgi:hypothetical protein